MNMHVNPNHKSKEWLLYCLHKGYSQREMAKLAGVSASSIRLWLRRFGVKWRTASESLSLQSDEVSKRAKKVWSDEDRRRKQSQIMRKVQATRKEELSASAKQNWANNREKIVKGIQAVAHKPSRIQKLSDAGVRNWAREEYRQRISASRQTWDTATYRAKISSALQGGKLTKDEFITLAVSRFNDRFDYSDATYTLCTDKIILRCNTCNHRFQQVARDHLRFGNCPLCNTSSNQFSLYESYQEHNPILNDRSAIAPLEIDIFFPQFQLAIEHHGLYWHSFNQPETVAEKMKHQNKWWVCSQKNIRLLQFFEHEIIHKRPIIDSIIQHRLGTSRRLDARKLSFRIAANSDAINFFAVNHLQSYRAAAITLGLYDGDEPVIMMSFSRFKDGYEIIRLATKTGYVVRGGASRLLRRFITQYEPLMIYTYADLRYSNGDGYRRLGFDETGITKPGYFYHKGLLILSRQKCQKHKLHKLLGDGYDPQLTEAENMFSNGFRRIWDAGHKKLRLTTT